MGVYAITGGFGGGGLRGIREITVSYTPILAPEAVLDHVIRLLLEKKKNQ